VQHDFAGLIARHGGNEAFVHHLDEFFDTGQYHSKETMLHVPYLYIYAGRPDKTAERVRECLKRFFHPTRDGLYDNSEPFLSSSSGSPLLLLQRLLQCSEMEVLLTSPS